MAENLPNPDLANRQKLMQQAIQRLWEVDAGAHTPALVLRLPAQAGEAKKENKSE